MMNFPLSDLSMSLAMQRNSRAVRGELQRAGQEMSTGQRTDLVDATNGNVGRIFSIDRSLALLSQQKTDLAKAEGRATASQLYLETVQKATSPFGSDLLAAVGRDDMISAATFAANSEAQLQAAVRALNGEFAGRNLFSGAAEDQTPLASAQTILTEVETILAGSADAATALSAIDDFFDDAGGGFETLIYSGATEDAASVFTPEGERIDYLMRADAEPIRETLKGLATAAAFSEGMFGGDLGEMATLLRGAGQSMIDGSDGVIGMRAELGAAEAGIAHAQAYIGAQTNSLQISRNEIAAVDVFDAAARFAELETQLTAVYTVTSRLSSLNLTNFLR